MDLSGASSINEAMGGSGHRLSLPMVGTFDLVAVSPPSVMVHCRTALSGRIAQDCPPAGKPTDRVGRHVSGQGRRASTPISLSKDDWLVRMML